MTTTEHDSMASSTFQQEVGRLSQMADRLYLPGRDHVLPGNGYASAPAFRYDLLPAELKRAVICQLGSDFFRKDIGRLAVSREWFKLAIETMYRHFDASTILYPFAPFDKCSVSPWFAVESSQPCGFAANPQFKSIIQSALRTHLHSLYVNVDCSIRDVCVNIGYETLTPGEVNKRIRQWRRDNQPPRKLRRPFHDDEYSIHREGQCFPEHAMEYASHAIQLLQLAPRAAELDIIFQEAWSPRYFDGHLHVAIYKTLEQSKLSTLHLDLAGLSPKRLADALDFAIELRAGQFIPSIPNELEFHYVSQGQENTIRYPNWNKKFHLCDGIRKALGTVETLHIRTPSLCSKLFCEDERYGQKVEPRLPKLKDVIINLAMPNGEFWHRRVCSCSTGTLILEPKLVQTYGDSVVRLMKSELTQLLERMDNPRKVRLRFTRRADGQDPTEWPLLPAAAPTHAPPRINVDNDFVDEWDVLTGKVRKRPIDAYGVVTDED